MCAIFRDKYWYMKIKALSNKMRKWSGDKSFLHILKPKLLPLSYFLDFWWHHQWRHWPRRIYEGGTQGVNICSLLDIDKHFSLNYTKILTDTQVSLAWHSYTRERPCRPMLQLPFHSFHIHWRNKEMVFGKKKSRKKTWVLV